MVYPMNMYEKPTYYSLEIYSFSKLICTVLVQLTALTTSPTWRAFIGVNETKCTCRRIIIDVFVMFCTMEFETSLLIGGAVPVVVSIGVLDLEKLSAHIVLNG